MMTIPHPSTFPGTAAEAVALINAIERNCDCTGLVMPIEVPKTNAPVGRFMGRPCGAHQLLMDPSLAGQHVINGLLASRRRRLTLYRQEYQLPTTIAMEMQLMIIPATSDDVTDQALAIAEGASLP